MVVLVPVPVEVTLPGLLVSVQVPDDGRSFKTTLPVATAQVGCVMVPMAGGVGIADTVTANVRVVLAPHELSAVTEIVPPVEPAVALMDVEVELPVHPEGNVQL